MMSWKGFESILLVLLIACVVQVTGLTGISSSCLSSCYNALAIPPSTKSDAGLTLSCPSSLWNFLSVAATTSSSSSSSFNWTVSQLLPVPPPAGVVLAPALLVSYNCTCHVSEAMLRCLQGSVCGGANGPAGIFLSQWQSGLVQPCASATLPPQLPLASGGGGSSSYPNSGPLPGNMTDQGDDVWSPADGGGSPSSPSVTGAALAIGQQGLTWMIVSLLGMTMVMWMQ